MRPGMKSTGEIREIGLYPFKSEVSCALVGKAAPVAFGKRGHRGDGKAKYNQK